MDYEWYKNDVKSWSDEILLDQLDACEECSEMCWSNAEDSFGDEREHWWEEMYDADKCIEIIKEEISKRGLNR